jgi:pimeloyl-ACP methyl ester carboxylesterase
MCASHRPGPVPTFLLVHLLAVAAAAAPTVVDQGHLQYRLQGQPCGHEDFVVEREGDELTWRCSSRLQVQSTTITMHARLTYDTSGSVPATAVRYLCLLDAGETTGGMVKIDGSFAGEDPTLTVAHPLSRVSISVVDAHRQQVPRLLVLDGNGCYATYQAVAWLAPGSTGGELQLPALIPQARNDDPTRILVDTTITRAAPQQVRIDLGPVALWVTTGAGGRLESVTIPSQGLEARRTGDVAQGNPGPVSHAPAGPRGQEVRVPLELEVLAGTLRRPDRRPATGEVPAVLFLGREGAQNRDGNSLGSADGRELFPALADALAALGVASLRLDDPGVAASGGSLDRRDLHMLVDDALRCFRFLAAQEGIDPERIGVLGHGEGGVIAPLLVVDHQLPVKALGLLASPSEPLDALLLEREWQRYQRRGLEGDALQQALLPQRLLLQQIRRATSWDEIRWRAGDWQQAPWAGELLEVSRLDARLRRWKHSRPLDYFKQHFQQDPTVTALLARTPTLVVAGTLDDQIPHRHALALAQALKQSGGLPCELLSLEGLDHVLCRPGQPRCEAGAVVEVAGAIARALKR